MKNEVIMDTYGSSFKCNNLIYSDYELVFSEQQIPYIKGKGDGKNRNKDINEKELVKDIFELAVYLKDTKVVEVVTEVNKVFKEIDKIRILKIHNFENTKSLVIGDLINLYFLNNKDISREERIIFNGNLYMLLAKCTTYFEKYGIPNIHLTENGYNLLDFIISLNDCYIYFDKLNKIDENFNELNVASASFELLKNEKGNIAASPYFEDPLEFAKFQMLISTLRDGRGVRECPHCHSIFIASRRDTIYCSQHCKARFHENKKYGNKNNKERK